MNLPFTKHTLGNGLDVLLHEDRDCPIVAVNIWYHVGSKNERPGHTGFAHLFEHLMFEGSEHHDHGYFQPLQGAGATLNGSTNADRTNYWEVVPSNAIAGDCVSSEALAPVDRSFGSSEPGERVPPVGEPATLPGQARIYYDDRVGLPRLHMAWLTRRMFAEGDADLDLAADLLANGK